jgi:YD repeat-containing protein
MKKIIYALLFVAFAFASCSNSDTVIPRHCLLTKSIDSLIDGGVTIAVYVDEFTYDSENKLIKMTSSSINSTTTTVVHYNYSYTNGMISSMSYEDTNNTANNYTANWTNENGRVTKITSPKFTTTFTYDVAGNLTHTALDAGDFDASFLRTYGTDKNMTDSHLVETWTGGGLTFDASYPGYDTKSNPFTLVATAMGQPYYFPRGEGFADDRFLFKNNPTKQLGDMVADFDYQYNTKNYPTKAIVTPSSGSTIVVKKTFEYANCD